VVVNRNTTVNSVAYANRGVNGGVTVVSRDTFVNARGVRQNTMQVPAKELAALPVSHTAGAEPARSSVLGAGTPTAHMPPTAAMNRQVVALRTPAPMPRSFDQRAAQAAGNLSQRALVRQEAPGRPVTTNQPPRPAQSQDGFRPFGQANAGNNQPKAQPRVWEEQGTPEPEKSTQAESESRNAQSSGISSQSRQAQQQWSHPLAKPAPAVRARNDEQQKDEEQKFNNWHQQKPAPTSPTPQRQQNSHPPAQSHDSAPKKGH